MKKILLGLSICLGSLLQAGPFMITAVHNSRNEKATLKVFDHDRGDFAAEHTIDSQEQREGFNLEVNVAKQTLYIDGFPQESLAPSRSAILYLDDGGVGFELL